MFVGLSSFRALMSSDAARFDATRPPSMPSCARDRGRVRIENPEMAAELHPLPAGSSRARVERRLAVGRALAECSEG